MPQPLPVTSNLWAAHRLCRCVVPIALLAMFGAVAADATPLRDKDGLGVAKWKNNTVIQVYIPPDPDGLGRDKDLGAGIGAWNGQPGLAGHGVSIQVNYGAQPPGAKNVVNVVWSNGPANAAGDDGDGNASGSVTGHDQITTGGTITINRKNVAKDDATGFGTHEMGHILGLADSPVTGSAMDHDVEGKATITPSDLDELKSVYGANADDTKINFVPDVIKDGGVFRYSYTATWLSGDALALFQLNVGAAQIFDIHAPSGWKVDDFMNGSDVSLDYSLSGSPPNILGFVLTDEVSYLGPANPVLQFSFASRQAPGSRQAYLNGAFSTTGPTIPEPSAWSLMIFGFTGIGLTLRSRRKHNHYPAIRRALEERFDAVEI